MTHNIKPCQKNELPGHSQLGCWGESERGTFTVVPESFTCLSLFIPLCHAFPENPRIQKKKKLPKSQEISDRSEWLLTVTMSCQDSGFSWKVM